MWFYFLPFAVVYLSYALPYYINNWDDKIVAKPLTQPLPASDPDIDPAIDQPLSFLC